MQRLVFIAILLGAFSACGDGDAQEADPSNDLQRVDDDEGERRPEDIQEEDTNNDSDSTEQPQKPAELVTIGDPVPCPTEGVPGVFTESAAQLGIVFEQNHVPTVSFGPNKELPVGGGVAVADFNGDQILDLYFANVGDNDELYLSKGPGKLEYTRHVQETAQMMPRLGVYPGDVDNDGDTDLLFSPPGVFPGLMTNDGAGLFTIEGPIVPNPMPNALEQSAAWADVNHDGHLDVIVAGGPQGATGSDVLVGAAERLFLGAANLKFVEQALPVPEKEGQAFIAAPVDVDNDGDLDIYIVNDFGMFLAPNRLLINDGQGLFSDGSDASDSDVGVWGMGLAVGDIDNDGWLDLYITTMSPMDDVLLHNLGAGVFDNVTKEWNASSTANAEGVAWGAIFIDGDSDGDEDLFVTHGYHSALNGPGFSNSDTQSNIYFRNDTGIFSEMTEAAGVGSGGMSRSPVEADLNADGFPDLVVGTIGGKPSIYINGCSEAVNWVGLRFKTAVSNRSALGTRITIEAGGRTHIREIGSGNDGLFGGGPSELTIGLGESEIISSLRIRWPNGGTYEWKDLPVKRWLTLWE